MTVELRPLGVNCNIACQYCYQNPQRDAGSFTKSYDIEAMKAAVEQEGGPFTLFGGEPLLVPEADLEALWSWGYEKYGSNGVQTNGALINDHHIRLFRAYAVHVGISIDGPGELNDARWAGSLEKTREATAKSEQAIERLCREGMPPSLIVTLHRANAAADKRPVLISWLRFLEGIGVSSVRLHLLEVENEWIRKKYALSTQENVDAMLDFARLEQELPRMRFDLFDDIQKLLLGQDQDVTCIWAACDPYTTRAVRGVEGTGQRSNCGRTNKEGIDYVKADREGYERTLALYHAPQDSGGCRGCRFFLMCKGQCPGTAIDGDWRNRTEHCEVWKSLFRHFEDRLLDRNLIPLSVHPFRKTVEEQFLLAWAEGRNPTIASFLQTLASGLTDAGGHADAHGDHGDSRGGR